MNEWKDIWKEEPPRNEEILFMTGDEEVHIGEIYSNEKLRKCEFISSSRIRYDCDADTPLAERVIYWHPLPQKPK
jgi:hypothetical protein